MAKERSSDDEPEWMCLARQLAEEIRTRRQTAGLSQPRLAARVGYTKQYVSLAERPGRGLPSASLVQALDDALDAGGALVMLQEQAEDARKACRPAAAVRTMAQDAHPAGSESEPLSAPSEEVTAAKRRELMATAAVAPEILQRLLSEAADEAMEFTRATGVSAVGRGMLEHLELVLTDLNQGFSHDPPAELFVVARAYRARVDELIRGQHTVAELRELYVYAGYLSELLSCLANDLGHPRAARAFAVDSYVHAEQAGYGELQGWAADMMTVIATYAGRPDQAVQAALKGSAHVPLVHPLAIQLRVKAARACAQLGDRERFETLFAEARRLHERMSTPAPVRFGLDTGTMASYAIAAYPAQAYRWLGDFPAAKTHSEAALAVHGSAPPGGSSPGKEAMARLVLATALTHLSA
ncbi:MAG TPA: helix-turn-helix transcriptional regulator, partial [Pseudonocardiaceae bacterium]|nr:helix-turn-helix transcriptional regulator [Pseudonocardiaceae bacterium]